MELAQLRSLVKQTDWTTALVVMPCELCSRSVRVVGVSSAVPYNSSTEQAVLIRPQCGALLSSQWAVTGFYVYLKISAVEVRKPH